MPAPKLDHIPKDLNKAINAVDNKKVCVGTWNGKDKWEFGGRINPLGIAIRCRNEAMVSLLLKHGANTAVPVRYFDSGKPYSALDHAKWHHANRGGPESIVAMIRAVQPIGNLSSSLYSLHSEFYKKAANARDDHANRAFPKSILLDKGNWALLSGPESSPKHWQKAKGHFDRSAIELIEGEKAYLTSVFQAEQRWAQAEYDRAKKEAISSGLISGLLTAYVNKSYGADDATQITEGLAQGIQTYSTEKSKASDRYMQEHARISRMLEEMQETPDAHETHDVRFFVPAFRNKVKNYNPFVNAIVQLVHSNSSCTGFLVSPDVAMTNAHCVYKDKNKKIMIDVSDASVILPGLASAEKITASVAAIIPNPAYAGCASDWAIIRLQQPIDASGVTYLEIALGADPNEQHPDRRFVATAGFPGDLYEGDFMTAHWGCSLDGVSPSMSYKCHSWGGASGSPIIEVTPGAKNWGKAIGIHACSGDGSRKIGTSSEAFVDDLQRYL